MNDFPRDTRLDATLAIWRDPYRYISRRARALDTDAFETRLLLRRTLCLTGRAAARVFYDPARFVRHGASPTALKKTLFGEGGVQGLDGEAHRHRKRMLLSLSTPDRVAALGDAVDLEWRRAAERWRGARVVLYPVAQEVLTRAVCAWAGVPLSEEEVESRTHDVAAMFDGAGSLGPRHLASRLARRRSERWATDLIGRIRSGELQPGQQTPVHRLASHRDLNGEPLPASIAAVELLNVLRPTVAIAVYVVFLAHALHEHDEYGEKLRWARADEIRHFVQEVRRLYPFFPAVPALVRQDFDWRGHRFTRGTRVLLDLYGIDHDPHVWDDPEAFRPERFSARAIGPYDLVPQGGGDHARDHRCAGEWITIELMERTLRWLISDIGYTVPEQDLEIQFGRLPALPKSRFVMQFSAESERRL